MKTDIQALRIGWLLLLFLIPALSIVGRSLQLWLAQQDYLFLLAALLAALLLLFSGYSSWWLIRRCKDRRLWLLVLFLPVYLLLPWFLDQAVERVHFLVFGLFGFITALVWSRSSAIIICLALAIGDEWLQWYLPDRVGDWRDVGFNCLAVMTSALFVMSARRA